MNLKSTLITAVLVTATHAQIIGKATINGAGSFDFAIDVDDLGEPGANVDKFGIQVSNGYARSGTLSGGNIQVHKSSSALTLPSHQSEFWVDFYAIQLAISVGAKLAFGL